MAQLSVYLPSFAGDYSGAAGVLFGFDCTVIVMDASCCTRNYTGYDEPRWASTRKTTFCAQLRTMEVTLGDDSRVLDQVEQVAARGDSASVALLGTPVPALVGMDLEGMALDLESRCGRPVVGISTTGFDTYEVGASLAQLQLLRKFCIQRTQRTQQEPTSASRVNILGACIQDFGSQAALDALTQAVLDAGFDVAWNTAGAYTIEDFASAANASKSLVVSESGLAAARYLQQEFGIPYELGVPEAALRALPGVETLMDAADAGAITSDLLILHDQIIANSIRDVLRQKGVQPQIKVASFFNMEESLMAEGDLRLYGELDVLDFVRNHAEVMLAADPLLARIPGVADALHFKLRHEAVSSNLYDDEGNARR